MAVVSVNPIREGRRSTRSLTGERRTRIYRAITTSESDDESVIYDAAGLPTFGDAFSAELPFLTVTEITPNQNPDNLKLWDVEITYSTPEVQSGTDIFIENPLEQPWDIEWDSVTVTEPIDQAFAWAVEGQLQEGDETGAGSASFPIQNVNGERFDPPLVEEFDFPLLTIVRNENSFTADTKILYDGKVNEDAFYGFPPGTAKMLPIQARRIIDPSFTYWRVRYQIEFFYNLRSSSLARSWWKRVLNEGWIVNVDDELLSYTDKEGQRPEQPAKLRADGGLLGENDTPVWLEFRTKGTAAFGPLQLEVQ